MLHSQSPSLFLFCDWCVPSLFLSFFIVIGVYHISFSIFCLVYIISLYIFLLCSVSIALHLSLCCYLVDLMTFESKLCPKYVVFDCMVIKSPPMPGWWEVGPYFDRCIIWRVKKNRRCFLAQQPLCLLWLPTLSSVH